MFGVKKWLPSNQEFEAWWIIGGYINYYFTAGWTDDYFLKLDFFNYTLDLDDNYLSFCVNSSNNNF